MLATGLSPLLVGGDHSVTFPAFRALATHCRCRTRMHRASLCPCSDPSPPLYLVLSSTCPLSALLSCSLLSAPCLPFVLSYSLSLSLSALPALLLSLNSPLSWQALKRCRGCRGEHSPALSLARLRHQRDDMQRVGWTRPIISLVAQFGAVAGRAAGPPDRNRPLRRAPGPLRGTPIPPPHFTDISSPSLLKHVLKGEEGAAE